MKSLVSTTTSPSMCRQVFVHERMLEDRVKGPKDKGLEALQAMHNAALATDDVDLAAGMRLMQPLVLQ